MDTAYAAAAFAALAQERRIDLLGQLQSVGSPGLAAGELSTLLGVPPSTLSFHLAALEQARLIKGVRRGRRVIYTVDAHGMRDLRHIVAQLCRCDGRPAGETNAALPAGTGEAPSAIAPVFNVLFLCRHNSARSIMAEAILAQIGKDRFRSYSAGPCPASAPLPQVVDMLRAHGHDVTKLRSKSWGEFGHETSAPVDFVITLCDMPDGARGPDFSAAVGGVWLLPDPTRFTGSARERSALLSELYVGLRRRLESFCRLPFGAMDRATARLRVGAIGAAVAGA